MIEREKETDANFYSRKKFYEKSSQLDVERLKSLQKFRREFSTKESNVRSLDVWLMVS